MLRARNTDFWKPWLDGSVEKEVTLVGGSATITDSSIAADDHFFAMHVSAEGGTRGALFAKTITNGASVKITSTNTSDTSRIRVIRLRVPNEQVV